MKEELGAESEIRGVLSLLKGGGEIISQLERELVLSSLLSGTDLTERIFSSEADSKSAARVMSRLYEELALYDVSAREISRKLQLGSEAVRFDAIADLFERYEQDAPYRDLPQIKDADILRREVVLFGLYSVSRWSLKILGRIPHKVVAFEIPGVSYDADGRLVAVDEGCSLPINFVSHPREYPEEALIFTSEEELLLSGGEPVGSPFGTFAESILRAHRTGRMVDLLTLARFSFVEKALQEVMKEEYPLIALDKFQSERLQLGFNLSLTGAPPGVTDGIRFLRENFIEILDRDRSGVLAACAQWAEHFPGITEAIEKLSAVRLPLSGGAEILSYLVRLLPAPRRSRLHFSELPALLSGEYLCGCVEGSLPISKSSFLTEGVRRTLGLPGREYRELESRYLLKLQQAIHPGLQVVVPKRDLRGDQVFPSRFILPGDIKGKAATLRKFFEEDKYAPTVCSGTKAFVFPQVSAPEKKKSYSISEIDLFRDAPFKYYLEKVLGLTALSDEASELDPLQFGSLAHRVLERFGRSEFAAGSEPEEIEKFLLKTLRAVAHFSYGENVSGAVHTQLRHLENRLRNFAYTQARLIRGGFSIEAVEVDVSGEIDGYQLHGRIDRIDRRGGLLRVIDYKLKEDGGKSLLNKNKEFHSLQLPLYGYLLKGFKFEELELCYITLDSEDSQLSVARVEPKMLQQAAASAREIIDRILAGEFQSDERLSGPYSIFSEVVDED
jgi:RecB family exonuclease